MSEERLAPPPDIEYPTDADDADLKPGAPLEAAGPKGQFPARDLRQELTDRMAATLEQGTIPWERPWQEIKAGRPRNMLSGRDYRGGNRFMLMMVQLEKGYNDSRFGTIWQINKLGGSVNKGEKGYPIEFWDDQPFYERRDVQIYHSGAAVRVFSESRQGVEIGDASPGAPRQTVASADLSVRHAGQTLAWNEAHQRLDRLMAKISTVFNVGQCNGLELQPIGLEAKTIVPTIERAERLMASMHADGLEFATDNAGAYYVSRTDTVYLPERERFASAEGYYGTALHEVGHATGAAKRLNRDGITGEHRFGTEAYAREELRAELFSVFMAAETGIPHDESQHRAYIQFWGKIVRADKNEIFRAAAEAGKAMDYVLQKEQELTKAPEHAAELQRESVSPQDIREITTAQETGPGESDRKRERRKAYARHRGLER